MGTAMIIWTYDHGCFAEQDYSGWMHLIYRNSFSYSYLLSGDSKYTIKQKELQEEFAVFCKKQ